MGHTESRKNGEVGNENLIGCCQFQVPVNGRCCFLKRSQGLMKIEMKKSH